MKLADAGVKDKRARTSSEVVAWEGLYVACFNVRYRELAGDDGLSSEWAALGERYRAQFNADTQSEEELDALYLEKHRIEVRESPELDLELCHQAQGDVNEHFFGKRTREEILADREALKD